MSRPEEAPPHRAEPPPHPRRWQALSVCLAAGFLTLLDVSIVNVALPSLRDDLHADESDLQWVLSGYTLAFGLVLVPAGRLGDIRGRRRVFLVGLGMFVTASVTCALAPSAGWLIAGRLFQGVAGGVLVPQSAGFIQELFSGAERGRAYGYLGGVIGLSTAVGPLLGGALIELGGPQLGWRLVFAANVPVGLVALWLAARLLPTGATIRRDETLDPVGVLLLGAAVFLLLLPLVEGGRVGATAGVALVGVALALLLAFLRWERAYERRGRHPMVDLDVFRTRSYSVGAVVALVYFAGFTSIFFTLALFLQSGRGFTALQAGLVLTPFAVGSAVSAALSGRHTLRLGRPLVAGGLALVAAGLVAADVVVATVEGPGVGWALAGPLLVAGVGCGFVITPNITLTLAEVPVRRAGSAGGVLQTGQRIGAALGIAVVGALFFARLEATGDWAAAQRAGLEVCTGFVLLALAFAVAELWQGRRG